MDKKPRVLILLSTYNGANFICEQINSLLLQEGVEISIIIRDDGSLDATTEILDSYCLEHEQIKIISKGNNIGAKASFFKLIQYAFKVKRNYDYFAFCDQDDVWEKGKLLRAVTVLTEMKSNIDDPAMYCSRTQMVDENLSILSKWPKVPVKPLTMRNALVENIAVGCTMVINGSAIKIVATHPPVDQTAVIMHDWWIYLSVSTFGRVFFDHESHIFYRQHNYNLLGGQNLSPIKKIKKRIIDFINRSNYDIRSIQAREFLASFKTEMTLEDKKDISDFLTSLDQGNIKRLIYTLQSPLYRQSFSDHLIFKLTLILGIV